MALPDGVVALGVGTVLALGAAVLVLGPLLRDDAEAPPPRPRPGSAREGAEGGSAVDALREIEFDRATGKLSDSDYRALKATYTREALAELRARDTAAEPSLGTATAVPDDVVERTIRRFRAADRTAVCPVDGARPEPDALFCSSCGRYLPGCCPHCGAACEQAEQRFCASCGVQLGAA